MPRPITIRSQSAKGIENRLIRQSIDLPGRLKQQFSMIVPTIGVYLTCCLQDSYVLVFRSPLSWRQLLAHYRLRNGRVASSGRNQLWSLPDPPTTHHHRTPSCCLTAPIWMPGTTVKNGRFRTASPFLTKQPLPPSRASGICSCTSNGLLPQRSAARVRDEATAVVI